MIRDFLYGLRQNLADKYEPYDASNEDSFHWRCDCGGHSQTDGFLSELDATYAAQRHQMAKGIDHAMPDVDSTPGPSSRPSRAGVRRR